MTQLLYWHVSIPVLVKDFKSSQNIWLVQCFLCTPEQYRSNASKYRVDCRGSVIKYKRMHDVNEIPAMIQPEWMLPHRLHPSRIANPVLKPKKIDALKLHDDWWISMKVLQCSYRWLCSYLAIFLLFLRLSHLQGNNATTGRYYVGSISYIVDIVDLCNHISFLERTEISSSEGALPAARRAVPSSAPVIPFTSERRLSIVAQYVAYNNNK